MIAIVILRAGETAIELTGWGRLIIVCFLLVILASGKN